MEVILLERIEKLGTIGDVVKVKNGFARNFLLPRGKALRANEANRKVFEARRGEIEAQNAERRTAAEKDSKRLEGLKIKLIRQASNTGQLYGSVSARDLVEALAAEGHKVARNQVVLDRPIKSIGVQDVKVALHPEVAINVQVNIARSPEEAELQAQGIDVMAQMFEKDVAAFVEEAPIPVAPAELEPGETLPEPEVPAEAEATAEAEAPAETPAAEAAEPDEAPAETDASVAEEVVETPAEPASTETGSGEEKAEG